MLTVSRVTLAKGLNYYLKDNYYTKDGGIENSDWFGRGAKLVGLSGKIDSKNYSNLLAGKLPGGLEMRTLIKETKDRKSRAATDVTFSAPKSVSLKALLDHDDAMVEAHKKAVARALGVLEQRYITSRVGSNSERHLEYSGNMIACQFHHDTSRAMDPGLHTHNLIMNGTLTKSGWRSVFDDTFRNRSKDIGIIYQNELAREVLRLGYDIDRNSNGTFELKGYSRDQILHYLKRHSEIRGEIERQGYTTKKQERAAVLKTRSKKVYLLERNLLWSRHRAEGEKIGLDAPGAKGFDAEFEPRRPSDFVDAAIGHLSQANVAFTKEEVESAALTFSLGKFRESETHDAVLEKIGGELIRVQSKKMSFPTDEMEKTLERYEAEGYQNAMFSKLYEFKNAGLSAISDEVRLLCVRERDNGLLSPLVEDGVSGVLGSRYRLNMANVEATKLSRFGCVVDIMNEGITVRGICPNTTSLREFGYAAPGASSIDNYFEFLKKPVISQGSKPEIWVIDHVSKMKTTYLRQILERAETSNVRVLFLGGDERLRALLSFYHWKFEYGCDARRFEDRAVELFFASYSRGIHDKIGS